MAFLAGKCQSCILALNCQFCKYICRWVLWNNIIGEHRIPVFGTVVSWLMCINHTRQLRQLVVALAALLLITPCVRRCLLMKRVLNPSKHFKFICQLLSVVFNQKQRSRSFVCDRLLHSTCGFPFFIIYLVVHCIVYFRIPLFYFDHFDIYLQIDLIIRNPKIWPSGLSKAGRDQGSCLDPFFLLLLSASSC